ncbi:L,D-transpeptidase [Thiomicrorhabdus xiamenensis]|uniref:L,D-transpeptidase n=1 Tax=Thiomicrorhabdus xiamenensis TaxID=2739063 RepID=A0A7D4P4I9_9GAMM|nr:L,D-transpeptidase [Thiomicrorhabdus xiamenensis]QKI89276.1 L,D-transpeptidase [Thiomicrorhabdus xiamenensis]
MKFSIQVSIADQQLDLTEDGRVLKRYLVSTALKGPGNLKNSGQTPIGKHYIRAKIGAGQPENTVFVGRRATGEIYSQYLAEAYPERDWILTRILWLCGTQPGINRLGNVDSMQRYIYIHGTPDSEPMGVPLSHGCIRMRNADIVELFDQVGYGTEVEIVL